MNQIPLNIFVYALCSVTLICFLHVEAADFSAKKHHFRISKCLKHHKFRI
uniref:Uncharacterized protein n=1 Tax=Mus musculus TaxID=10090 RepID=Q3USM1_MOUSE|nr:unnamed protein product [Mus musculus]